MRKASRAIIIKDDKIIVTHRNKFGMQYYILPGGGVDMGETLEQALYRELAEEVCVEVANPRLVFTEEAGEPYGTQYVYLCDYVSGEPALHPDSAEAKIHALGKNLYEPRWLSLAEFATIKLRSESLKQAILEGIKNGWPTEPTDVTGKANA
ncbi:MAG TPA: NUDIX domain-containing protein [Candidatus Saccharimonadales bacterium]|jgi:ADP-ribose pyrophosphatase YjhB (NUDIX family)|nr:NUDIX domain-containing protein [Candidatus Saccharimonadales bacterium]